MAKKKNRKPAVVFRKKETLLPEQDFFRRIDFPTDFRRNLLEGSKSTLSALKGVYSVKDIRQKKLQKLMELQRSIREIRLLIQKAEELMPKYAKHHAVKRFPQLGDPKPVPPPKQIKPAPMPKPPRPQPHEVARQRSMSELDRLSQSLAHVEKKISSLPNQAKGLKKKTGEPAERVKETTDSASVPKSEVVAIPEDKKKPEEHDDIGVELGKALERIHKKLREI